MECSFNEQYERQLFIESKTEMYVKYCKGTIQVYKEPKERKQQKCIRDPSL